MKAEPDPDPDESLDADDLDRTIHRRERRGWNWAMVVVAVVVVMAVAGLSAPVILRCPTKPDRIQATSNAKNLGIALFEFNEQFGNFPGRDTEVALKEWAKAQGAPVDVDLSGDSANAFLRQLVAYNVDAEEIFFAKTSYTRKPDNNIVGARALEPGELGFGYVMLDQTTGQNASGHSQRPVLVSPLLDAGATWEFDPDPFDGKAIVLRLDQSAAALQIRDSDKKISVGNGKTIDQTGEGTAWGITIKPVLRAPEKKR